MTCNIVVSYYNNQNFIKLLNVFEEKFLHSHIAIIYNKSEEELTNNFMQIHLDNIGREGETYLNHIIQNYDNLSEYTIFIQDDTNNHLPDYYKFIRFCDNIITQKKKFALYPAYWRQNGFVVKRRIIDGIFDLHTFPSKNAIKLCCQEHNIYLPKEYTTETCAFFICHKSSILIHDKVFYIKLRSWLLSNINNGFVLEHVWKLIFSDANLTSLKR